MNFYQVMLVCRCAKCGVNVGAASLVYEFPSEHLIQMTLTPMGKPDALCATCQSKVDEELGKEPVELVDRCEDWLEE